MRTLGNVVATLLVVFAFLCSLLMLFGFLCSLLIIAYEFGLLGTMVAFILAPLITYAGFRLYMVIKRGDSRVRTNT